MVEKSWQGSHGDNALVDHSFAKGVQLLCCRILDGNARLFGKGDDFAHAAAVGSFEDIDAVDRATFSALQATALRPAMTELSRDWFSDTVSLGTCNTSEKYVKFGLANGAPPDNRPEAIQ